MAATVVTVVIEHFKFFTYTMHIHYTFISFKNSYENLIMKSEKIQLHLKF